MCEDSNFLAFAPCNGPLSLHSDKHYLIVRSCCKTPYISYYVIRQTHKTYNLAHNSGSIQAFCYVQKICYCDFTYSSCQYHQCCYSLNTWAPRVHASQMHRTFKAYVRVAFTQYVWISALFAMLWNISDSFVRSEHVGQARNKVSALMSACTICFITMQNVAALAELVKCRWRDHYSSVWSPPSS